MKKFLATMMMAALCAAAQAQTAASAPAASGAASASASTSGCEAKAVDKNGKALAGAAKASSVKKCVAGSAAPTAPTASAASTMGSAGAKPAMAAASASTDPKTMACQAKAVDKNGKALAGAAKASSVKKCVAAA